MYGMPPDQGAGAGAGAYYDYSGGGGGGNQNYSDFGKCAIVIFLISQLIY
jgi:hypothetical protein